jgi:hypothetical protein
MSNLEAKIKKLEEIILQKNMPKEDKEELLEQVKELRRLLRDKEID